MSFETVKSVLMRGIVMWKSILWQRALSFLLWLLGDHIASWDEFWSTINVLKLFLGGRSASWHPSHLASPNKTSFWWWTLNLRESGGMFWLGLGRTSVKQHTYRLTNLDLTNRSACIFNGCRVVKLRPDYIIVIHPRPPIFISTFFTYIKVLVGVLEMKVVSDFEQKKKHATHDSSSKLSLSLLGTPQTLKDMRFVRKG